MIFFQMTHGVSQVVKGLEKFEDDSLSALQTVHHETHNVIGVQCYISGNSFNFGNRAKLSFFSCIVRLSKTDLGE